MIHGDARRLSTLADNSTDLVLTSPPYFAPQTEPLLTRPTREQTESATVWQQVEQLARSLAPAYREIARILRPDRAFVLQIKDLRYGGELLPLTHLHREMAIDAGFRVRTRIFVHIYDRRSPGRSFLRKPVVRAFRADEVEEVLVLSREPLRRSLQHPVLLPEEELYKLTQPLWRCGGAKKRVGATFPFAPSLARKMIELFTEPGEQVVDPFAGTGIALSTAASLRRPAVGYEIDPERVREFHSAA
jgi:DNA modification methylase